MSTKTRLLSAAAFAVLSLVGCALSPVEKSAHPLLGSSPGVNPSARAKFGDPPEYEVRDRQVTVEDERILVRAAELLADESVWNKNDDRLCVDDESAGKRSLFCALHAASVQVLGSYDHRRVALQEVRFAVIDVTRGQELEHRLMGFNNLPQTRIEDIKGVLATALARVRARLSPEKVVIKGARVELNA